MRQGTAQPVARRRRLSRLPLVLPALSTKVCCIIEVFLALRSHVCAGFAVYTLSWLENAGFVAILLYIVTYFHGRKQNESIALRWCDL